VIGMAALAVAIVTGSTVIALIVIGLATVGLLLLARDWLKQRAPSGTAGAADLQPDERRAQDEVTPEDRALNPDLFEPDVPYDEALEEATKDENLDREFDGEEKGDSET
jgi:hypothetical protein